MPNAISKYGMDGACPWKKEQPSFSLCFPLSFFLGIFYIKSQELEVSVDRQKEMMSVGERYQIIPVY